MQAKLLSSIFFLSVFLQGCTSLFFYPDKTIYTNPSEFGLKYKDVYFDSKDKTRLHAWHIYPKTSKAKGLIFLAHGNAQNLSSHFTAWIWLIQEGYELFIFDYREYGQSTGKNDLKGSIEDTSAALSYLENNYTKEYVAVGQSLGGTLLLNALQNRDNTQIQAVVIDSTFSGFSEIASQKMNDIWLTWPFQWVPYLSLSSKYDAKEKVAKIKKPLLFLHGSLDRIISVNESWKLFELSSLSKELWIVKEAKHIQALENEKVRKDFLKFIDEGKEYFEQDVSRMKIYE